MELKDHVQTIAINKGYRCPFPPIDKTCPVTDVIDNGCTLLKKEIEDKKE